MDLRLAALESHPVLPPGEPGAEGTKRDRRSSCVSLTGVSPVRKLFWDWGTWVLGSILVSL